MDEDKTYQVELSAEEVEVIHSLLEQQVDSGDDDEIVTALVEIFEELTDDV